MSCPCDSKQNYQNCCGNFLEAQQLPETPEELMRSRYTAFTKSRLDYIENTQCDAAAKQYNRQSIAEWVKKAKWLDLRVLSSSQDGDFGEVEFIARYTENGKAFKIYEWSQFKRIVGKWFYVSGV